MRKDTKKKRHIMPGRGLPSVKEGMDNLPFGIAFATMSGMVFFCNYTMNRISHSVQDAELQNASLFWERVEEKAEKTADGSYILRIDKDPVWMLSRKKKNLNGGDVYEITAQDVTERMALIDRLNEDNKNLMTVGQRLKQYNMDALELARSRELLERKEHTHDELGKLLSATRHYLNGGEVDKDALWRRWHINTALMLEESHLPAEDDLLECLKKTADAAGVKLSIIGDIPEDDRVRELLLAAGGECITNLLRHTKSNELFLRVEEEDSADIIIFTNGGVPPEDDIAEGGGLLALRRKVERAGGRMDIASRPAYCLRLTIPARGSKILNEGGTDHV